VKAIASIFKLICSMAFFAAGAMVGGGYEAALFWAMSAGFFLFALGY
jgi:hypothetical protein